MTEVGTSPIPAHCRVGLVGYGEVGRILAEDLRARGVAAIGAYDLKLGTAQEGPLVAHAARHGVRLAASHEDLAAEADLVICAVTASQTVIVAEAWAPAVRPGTWFLDFNSASPGAKVRAAALIEERLFELGASMSLEVGKNRMESLGDVQETADLIYYSCYQMDI